MSRLKITPDTPDTPDTPETPEQIKARVDRTVEGWTHAQLLEQYRAVWMLVREQAADLKRASAERDEWKQRHDNLKAWSDAESEENTNLKRLLLPYIEGDVEAA